MKNKLLLTLLFLFAIISDQITKYLIAANFNLYESKSLIGNFLNFHYIKNPGAAFGLTIGHPLLMLGIIILIVIILGYLFLKGNIFSENMLGKTAMILVIGGAFGNLIDRVRFMEVVDFIDMGIGNYRWPVYNLADVYVTIGMCIMIFYFTFIETPGHNTNADSPE